MWKKRSGFVPAHTRYRVDKSAPLRKENTWFVSIFDRRDCARNGVFVLGGQTLRCRGGACTTQEKVSSKSVYDQLLSCLVTQSSNVNASGYCMQKMAGGH